MDCKVLGTLAAFLSVLLANDVRIAAAQEKKTPDWYPQETVVKEDKASGKLVLSTPYYTVEHDTNKGGVIARIHYTYGKADNLLLRPIATSVDLANGEKLSDMTGFKPAISWSKNGLYPTVTVEGSFSQGIKIRTTYNYRWGYIKIHKEVIFPQDKPTEIKSICILSTLFDPSLSDCGYRNAAAVEEESDPYSVDWTRFTKMRAGEYLDSYISMRYVPKHIVLVNRGIEGIEWIMSSKLSQFDYQMTGRPGDGMWSLNVNGDPLGISFSICPLDLSNGSVAAKGTYVFDYYIGMSITDGQANKPFLHSVYNAHWPTEEQIKTWSQAGIINTHFHQDGDSYRDGEFWRDGSYPPLKPENMKEYDRVIENCHKYGIEVSTYFSNKELHPSTEAFKEHGAEWARKADDKGTIMHNPAFGDEYGGQMCLQSGWLNYFESYVDMVLKKHKLDGVYYDWSMALYCNNPAHMGMTDQEIAKYSKGIGARGLSPAGHWDIDGLIELMEWTRQRVGPDGLVIIHNTAHPMFITENFANYVVGLEGVYTSLKKSVPPMGELPLEWEFAGARSRGMISSRTVFPGSAPELQKLVVLKLLMASQAPWPAADNQSETDLFSILKPLGDIEQYRFADWRNEAVHLGNKDCSSAVYSKPGEAWVLIANFSGTMQTTTCSIHADKLAHPLNYVGSSTLSGLSHSATLNVNRLLGAGEEITVPGYTAVLIHLVK